MKKIIAILFILVNALLFFNIREVFMENDLSDVFHMQRFYPDIVDTSLIISNLNNESISDESSEAIFDMFRYLTQRYDMLIVYEEFIFERDEYNLYFATDTPIDQRLGLVTDVSLNFNEQDDYFYTNQHNIENSINFFLLNNRLDVRISPITAMGTIRGGEYTLIATSQADLDEIVALFLAEFDSYVDQVIDFSGEPLDVEEEINAFLSPIILVTMVLIFLIIIMYIHIYSKKIAVFKTMGISFFHLVKQLFLPLLILIALTIVITSVVLFFLFVSALNVRTIPIIETLVRSGGMQLLGVITTMVVSCLLLLLIPTYSLLKNSNINRFLMGANYLMKIVVLVMMLPLISERFDLIQDNLRMINPVRHYERNGLLADYQFSPMLHPRYRGDGYSTLFMELIMEVGIDNIDPDIIYEHELLYEYHRAFRILNEAGAIFCQSSEMFSGEPLLVVNENYVAKHSIRDLYGDLVDLSQGDSDIVFLIPEIYLERGFVTSLINSGDEIVVIENDQSMFDYSLGWRVWGLPSQQYALMVYRDTAFRFDASPFHFVFIDDDINELLSDTSFYDRILVSTVGDELNRIREWHLHEVTDHIMMMAPTFALVLIIIVQYSYLFLKVFKKRIYAKKIMGHNPLRIFSRLLLESSLAVVVAIFVAWYVGFDFRLLMMIILFDIFVYLAIVAISQWRHSLVFDYYE